MLGFRARPRLPPRKDAKGGTKMSRTCGRIHSPKKIYKWIRGTTAVWDLAVHDENGFAHTPDDTAKVELGAWSKLWRPTAPELQKLPSDKPSEWSFHALRSGIKHCPSGKARGADRSGMNEIKLLLEQVVRDLMVFLKCVEVKASWPPALREMLYLQLPEEGAKNAGERRPIALLPQVYRLWSACCRADVLAWRQLCKDRGETPVGQGALDETFDLAFLTEQRSAAGQHQTGASLIAANATSGGQRRILVQGIVSEGVTARCGLPLGCGHAVDMLHAF
eukprot:612539-Amphidinium_carterae.2